MQNIKAIRGAVDILPEEINKWSAVENLSRDLFAKYGYAEIRTPIIEETGLFIRSIGDTTDIVQKQMYTFQDRGGRSITLRPEATAPVIRAYLEHNLGRQQAVNKLFYIGPMFRSERPQAGRHRQFHQIGVEAIGLAGPYLDAEVISLAAAFLEKSGVRDFIVNINSLGCVKDKLAFAGALKEALKPKRGNLCEDCQGRFEKNIFRILDCKNAGCKNILPDISMLDYLCKDCRLHFEEAKDKLNSLGVKYTINKRLARGLDYYTKTVFEITAAGLGSQDAIAAGGRYDNLVKDLGGPDTPAVGFAIGIERLLLAAVNYPPPIVHHPKVYFAALGEEARKYAFKMANDARNAGICCLIEYEDKSLKSQLKAASNQGCKYAAILGDEELKKGKVIWRDMSASRQSEIDIDGFAEYARNIIFGQM